MLLASCDGQTAAGRRDFAVLMLLPRLGLRAGEVAALQLEDIDWRAGVVKGRREEKMPLPHDIGEALAGYLRQGRPAVASRLVFVRSRAPLRGLTPQGVSDIVARAASRAGLSRVSPHRLRHLAAAAMQRGLDRIVVGKTDRQQAEGMKRQPQRKGGPDQRRRRRPQQADRPHLRTSPLEQQQAAQVVTEHGLVEVAGGQGCDVGERRGKTVAEGGEYPPYRRLRPVVARVIERVDHGPGDRPPSVGLGKCPDHAGPGRYRRGRRPPQPRVARPCLDRRQ